ncbi:MAG: nucleotide-binding protein [Candidatus Thermoplasmatota archaeon]|nr:nucleotide-binding protein [Candidatus Thermoplasmatota archaeon]
MDPKPPAKYVIDSSALLAGVSLELQGEILIPDAVLDELKQGSGRRRLEGLLAKGAKIATPPPSAVEKARKFAEEKEAGRLSLTDVQVVALALDVGGVVVSDDYGIQNLCKHLGIPSMPLSEKGIEEVWKWKLRCKGCGKWFDSPVKECPVCGSEVVAKRVKNE